MSETVEALVLDLLEFVSSGERSYAEVIEVWRTSCPRLPVWEEANERGLIRRERVNGKEIIRITADGAAALEAHRG
jgi:hypothetical protein